MSTAPRYSSSWSSGAFITRDVPVPDVPTQFEKLVSECGLEHRPDQWRYSKTLVRFARQCKNTRYVPESFLEELGLKSEVEL